MNALSPMLVNLESDGMLIDCNEVQLLNAYAPMLVTPDGMLIDWNEHLLNASSPMLVNLESDGMLIDCNEVQ